MCTSPHEMTSLHIEELVSNYERSLEVITDDRDRRWHQRQISNFTAILKERAESGTYESAGYHRGDRHETQRTAYQS